MPFTIRRARHSDARGIYESHVRSIREICAPDYTPEQVAAWSGRPFRETHLRAAMDRDLLWVVVKASTIQGFAHLALMDATVAEVMGLYLTTDVRGEGAGKGLLGVMEEEARRNGIKELHLHSTLTALAFYRSRGFTLTAGMDTVEIGGVPIPCYPLKLALS